MNKGFFVTFEGGEGAGKSTQIRLLAERLCAEGKRVRCLREPGGTLIGEELRHVLKYSPLGQGMCPETELFLLEGSRAQLVHEVIRPALYTGEVVLCDRFYDSTLAYQGYGRGLSVEVITGLNVLAVGNIHPDLTFFLDISPLEGLRVRRGEATALTDRFDETDIAFHERVYRGFQEIARAHPARIITVPYRAGEVQRTHAELSALFSQRYAQRNP